MQPERSLSIVTPRQYIPYMPLPKAPHPSIRELTMSVAKPVFHELISLPPIPFFIEGSKNIYKGVQAILDNEISNLAIGQLCFGVTLTGLMAYNFLLSD